MNPMFDSVTKIAAHAKNVALMKFLSDVSRRKGFGDHVYVVGGAVRNWVIKQPIKDIDLLVDTVALGHTSEWVAQQIAKAIPVETNLTTNQYGVAILTVKGAWDLDGHPMQGEVIEIAAARKESYGGETGKGYKPDTVEPATVQEDVVRREFTFNTLMWRLMDLAQGPEKAQIIDLTGCGLKDLQEGRMQCPADPDKVFSDDPSRLIRIVKFVSRYGFKLTPDTEAAAKRNAPKLVNVPHNAVSKLLAEVLVEAKAKQAVALMDRLGLLDVVRKMVETIPPFREALNNWGNAQSVQYMFDLMDIGLVTKAKVGFLTPEQQKRVREIAVTLGAEEAEQFLAVLKQPGKVLDMVGMASELGLAGAAMKNLMDAARNVLLAHPEWVHNPATWTAHTKGTYMRQFTKAAFATVQQRVATRYLQAFQFGLAQAFADQVGMPDRMNLAKLDRLFRDAFLDAFKDLGYSLEGTLTPGRTNWISLRGEGHPNSPSYEETEVEVLESAFGTVADSFRADVFVRNFLVPSAPTQFFRQHEKQIVAFFLNAQNEKQINLFLRSMQSEVLGKLGDTLTHESLGAETADLFEQHSSAGLEPLEASSTVVTDFVAIVKRPLFIVRAKVVLKYDPKEVRPDRG